MSGDSLIIKSKIKDYAIIDNKPLSVAGDFADALNDKVVKIVQEACRRAKENGRNTVMKKDL